jgi:N utilization substance protein A
MTRQRLQFTHEKKIVDGVYDPVTEIELEEALSFDENCEIAMSCSLKSIQRNSTGELFKAQSKRQNRRSGRYRRIPCIQSSRIKSAKMIVVTIKRERNGNIFVDLGKVEGILPKKFQSPRETYRQMIESKP